MTKQFRLRKCYAYDDNIDANVTICEIQVRLFWVFWVTIKTMQDDDEEYIVNEACEVLNALRS